MAGFATRVATLLLAFTPLVAVADSAPQVSVATPGREGGAIHRFTLRFSAPMVPLGDPRAPAPVSAACAVAGSGRWVDQQTYVYEFAQGLPGGTKCQFKLIDGLRSQNGYAIAGQSQFTVNAGGPFARARLPHWGQIAEDQVFLIAPNAPADRASVAANAYCSVEGIGEKIPVEVLKADTAQHLLGAMGDSDYNVQDFLSEAGLPEKLPASAADQRAMLANIIAVKCRRALPPAHDVALVWPASIAGAGGLRAGEERRFDFSVRPAFSARFECSRTNPQAGCSPVEAARLTFTAPIATAQARAIRLQLADGRTIAPMADKNENHTDQRVEATVDHVQFAPPFVAHARARIILPANLRDENGRALENASRFPLDVRFDDAPPLIKFAADFGILEARQGGVLPVTVRNVEPQLAGRGQSVAGQSLRVADSDAQVARWLMRGIHAGDSSYTYVGEGDSERAINHTGEKPIVRGGAPIKIGLPGKGRDFEVVGIPLGKPGFYVVEFASPVLGRALLGRPVSRYVATTALVTNMAVHFKHGGNASLAWVTTLDRGLPVAGADIGITDACTGKRYAAGRTGADGTLRIAAVLPAQTGGQCATGENAGSEGDEDSEYDSNAHPLMVSARAGGDFSFVLTSWNQGISRYDFDLGYETGADGPLFHTVFDRALARQGEAVHMKHLLRATTATGFRALGPFRGTLTLSHSGSGKEFTLPVTIDTGGDGETSWAVPKDAPLGDYSLQIKAPAGPGGKPTLGENGSISGNQSLRVDEYRLPTMHATITPPKTAMVRPRAVPLDLFVGFLSGGGASRLPVDVRVGWFSGSANAPGYEAYQFGGTAPVVGTRPMNGDGEEQTNSPPPLRTLPLRLDAAGTARQQIEVPASIDGYTNMRVEMDYQDASGEVLTASQLVPIYPAAVQLGVRTDGWLMKQDDLRLRFVTLDADGHPVKGQKIDVALYSRQILTARRRLIGGFYAYDNQVRTARIAAHCATTSDARGLAQCKINPGISGEVYAVATTHDASGNVARAVQSVWLAGADEWWFGGDNGDRMDVVAERPSYRAGETARFQVRMPFRHATALVTVEREGVLSSFVTQLSGTDPVVSVPMNGSYAPNVYVSVLAVRGRVETHWYDWIQRLGSWLGLATAPDPAPPATATVDLSKPAFRLGIAHVTVGWEAHRLGVKVTADRARYAPRDVARVALAVTRPDGKPAAQADVAFVAVDKALELLSPNDSVDVLKAVMGERALGVDTATAQTQVVGKRHYGKKAVAAGGGGGGDGAAALNRESFQPVLLWRGHVPLDASGHARVAVPVSDALSSFRLVAVATEGAELYGMGETEIRSAQDLSIFSGVPPLVRSGDRFGAVFTLRNGADHAMTVTARVTLAPGIAIGRPLTVTVPGGGAVPVMWNLRVPEGLSGLRWQVEARSADGKAADRISVDQQVAPAVPVESWAATLARVGEGGIIPVAAPAGALPGRGGVSIALSDTLAPPLDGIQSYMRDYPYNCLEQQLSRIVVLGDAAGWGTLAGALPVYQARDGLLRYWPDERLDGSEALTAYILALASDAGLAIPEGPRARMIEALKAVVDGRLNRERHGDDRLRRLVAFAALARAGAATPAMLGQLHITPREMATAQLGDYMVAIDHVPGLANAPALRAAAEAELRTRLVYEGTRLDLSDQDRAAWWLMSSGDEGAIKALLAVTGRPGWEAEGPRMMLGAAARQSRGHWDTTTANAWGAVAVRRFASQFPAEAVAGVTHARLGDRTIDRAWPLAVGARALSFALPRARTPLSLSQTGGAGPWATVSVNAAVPLRAAVQAGYGVAKKIEPVSVRHPGRWTRGDVLKVTLTITASAERNWVVVSDPVAAGATVISDLGGQSALLNQSGSGGAGYPSYVERPNGYWRGYYEWLPAGTTTISYSVRLNGVGRFMLPPTHVEAMYSPAIHADVPNAPVSVGAN